MVLIGFRKDADRNYFLLQNWWKNKQFIEVDSEYLHSCEAIVHFVTTAQDKIPEDFNANDGHFFETQSIDKCEDYQVAFPYHIYKVTLYIYTLPRSNLNKP